MLFGAPGGEDVAAGSGVAGVGVIGAGFMGAGIAYVTALAGLEVVLIDRDIEAAEKGKAYSHKLVSDQIMKGRAKTADRDALLRLRAAADQPIYALARQGEPHGPTRHARRRARQ